MTIDEDQNLTTFQWEKLLISLAKVFDTTVDNVVFGYDYYSKKIQDLEFKLSNADGILEGTELEGWSTEMQDGWREDKYMHEMNLSYELPNPLTNKD
jgi:hypothetical protein